MPDAGHLVAVALAGHRREDADLLARVTLPHVVELRGLGEEWKGSNSEGE